MPKLKTRKGLAKRLRITRRGKIMRSRAGRRKLMSGKTGKRRRQLRRKATVARADVARTKRAMFT